MKRFTALAIFVLAQTPGALGQTILTPNGFSGLGLTPSASTIEAGKVLIDHTTALPGAANYSGHNNQIGFGLNNNLEFVGRLATQDLHCNMYRSACPVNQIRDVSGSFKFQLPLDYLERRGTSAAIGLVDVGGAASYFRSEYFVIGQKLRVLNVNLGVARSKGPYAILGNKTFGSVSYSPTPWATLGVQAIGSEASAHASLSSQPSSSGITTSLTINRRLTSGLKTPEEWFGFSVAVPLDGVKSASTSAKLTAKVVNAVSAKDLDKEFERLGFYKVAIGRATNGSHVFEIENASYQWNALDAAGVALGVIAGAYGQSPNPFELLITTRGLVQLKITGDAKCVKDWFEGNTLCSQLKLESALTNAANTRNVTWEKKQTVWNLRPEFVVSPVVVSGVGTEFGALDLDVGMNANVVLPLWTGAIWDLNRVEPVGFNTKDFERGRPFYSSRIQAAVNRRMFHQTLSVPMANTQIRLSSGVMHTRWRGEQIETQTTSNDGRHRLGITVGDFTDRIRSTLQKDYYLYTYRYALDSAQRYSSELTYGKFWNGDTGYQVNQRFWYGDTNLNIYVRRTKQSDGDPFVSFAGIQISLPFTPRNNPGAKYASVRGVNQWTYTLESRILENANPVGGGFGEVPNAGENLQRIFNRDRSGTAYFQAESWRLKDAFLRLTD